MLRVLRLSNTALDASFYDVGVVISARLWQNSALEARSGESAQTIADDLGTASGLGRAFNLLDIESLSNPEGTILVVDASRPPYVTSFSSVSEFLERTNRTVPGINTVSVTGGGSALGSAAFAWNISMALRRPVAAIVPGYGLADAIHQAFGGCFSFRMHDWVQDTIAAVAPSIAQVGHELLKTVPGSTISPATGTPVFQRGGEASDILHSILRNSREIANVFSHSKGALAVADAIRDLPDEMTARLSVVTFGCSIAEDIDNVRYTQYLGVFDWLGAFNSWFNQPSRWILAEHTTNTMHPLSIPVTMLAMEHAAA